MSSPERPHLLGIDDGPFDRFRDAEVPLVGVVMEGSDLVEGVVVSRLGVDGDDVTRVLASWIESLRFRPALHGVVLGGITIAGLSVVDVPALAATTGLPVMAVGRKPPTNEALVAALETAGFADRAAIVARTPPARAVGEGLFAACAGVGPDVAAAWLRAACRKSALPEPLRMAHLIAAAIAKGSSRGRV